MYCLASSYNGRLSLSRKCIAYATDVAMVSRELCQRFLFVDVCLPARFVCFDLAVENIAIGLSRSGKIRTNARGARKFVCRGL